MSYMELRTKYLRLQAEYNALKNPVLSHDEREKRMADIRAYFDGENSAKGAVCAANLYNAEFFKDGIDPEFKRDLLTYLLDRFKTDSAIIDGSYNLWIELNGALK